MFLLYEGQHCCKTRVQLIDVFRGGGAGVGVEGDSRR